MGSTETFATLQQINLQISYKFDVEKQNSFSERVLCSRWCSTAGVFRTVCLFVLFASFVLLAFVGFLEPSLVMDAIVAGNHGLFVIFFGFHHSAKLADWFHGQQMRLRYIWAHSTRATRQESTNYWNIATIVQPKQFVCKIMCPNCYLVILSGTAHTQPTHNTSECCFHSSKCHSKLTPSILYRVMPAFRQNHCDALSLIAAKTSMRQRGRQWSKRICI